MSGGVSRSSGVIAERDDGDDGLVGGVVNELIAIIMYYIIYC
jgi:hypothetical protein